MAKSQKISGKKMHLLATNAATATIVAIICMFFLIVYDKVFTTIPGVVVLFLLACISFLCDKNVGILTGAVFSVFVLYAHNTTREGARGRKELRNNNFNRTPEQASYLAVSERGTIVPQPLIPTNVDDSITMKPVPTGMTAENTWSPDTMDQLAVFAENKMKTTDPEAVKMFVTRFKERYIDSATNTEVKEFLKLQPVNVFDIKLNLWPWKQETINTFKQRLSDGALVKTLSANLQKSLRKQEAQDLVIMLTRTQLTDTNAKYLTSSDETLSRWTEYILTQGVR